MQTYEVACACLVILSLSAALDTAAESLRVPPFCFAAAAVGTLLLTKYTFFFNMTPINAGAAFWTLLWFFALRERGTLYAIYISIPFFAGLLREALAPMPDNQAYVEILNLQLLVFFGCLTVEAALAGQKGIARLQG